jgi:hypothetical protein
MILNSADEIAFFADGTLEEVDGTRRTEFGSEVCGKARLIIVPRPSRAVPSDLTRDTTRVLLAVFRNRHPEFRSKVMKGKGREHFGCVRIAAAKSRRCSVEFCHRWSQPRCWSARATTQPVDGGVGPERKQRRVSDGRCAGGGVTTGGRRTAAGRQAPPSQSWGDGGESRSHQGGDHVRRVGRTRAGVPQEMLRRKTRRGNCRSTGSGQDLSLSPFLPRHRSRLSRRRPCRPQRPSSRTQRPRQRPKTLFLRAYCATKRRPGSSLSP